MKSPWKSSREARKGFPTLPLAERRAAFIGWIGDDLKYAVEWMRTWKDGGLLPYENAEDITHSCLDKIKADVKAFKAGVAKWRRLNEHNELEGKK